MRHHLPSGPAGLLSVAALLALGGCAGSGTPPNAQLARADLAVQQAVAAQAAQYAGTDLSQAQTDLAAAHQAANDGRFAEARRKADLAESEAQLAQARTGAAQARQASSQMTTTVNELKQEAVKPASPAAGTTAVQPGAPVVVTPTTQP